MYTVLVADDEEELRKALIRNVQWEDIGFQVIGEAENGVEALEMVEKLEPDLLLSDIRMPFMSGIELARAIREVRPTTQIAFLSGFDEFSYAQQAIQYNIISYMLKPISSKEITEELITIKGIIDKRFKEFTWSSESKQKQSLSEFVMMLLLDPYQGNQAYDREKSIDETAVELGLISNNSEHLSYVVMVTGFIDGEGSNQTGPSGVNSIDTVLKKYLKHTSFYAHGKIISLLCGTSVQLKKYLHIIAEEVTQGTKRITGLSASIGISRIVPKLIYCHDAYTEAIDAMSFSMMNEDNAYFISDIERMGSINHELIQATVGKVESMIRSGEKSDLEDYLVALFDRIEKEKFPPIMVQTIIVQMVAAVMRVAYGIVDDESMHMINSLSPLRSRISVEDSRSGWKQYVDFCLVAKDILSEDRKKNRSSLCEQAVEIINTQYMDQDISLVSVSSDIAVSPNYLSAIIKKELGKTFIELLTEKRMEIAKELLNGTQLKVGDIADKCGYNNQNYFSYCFKKYTKVSPNTYRSDFSIGGKV